MNLSTKTLAAALALAALAVAAQSALAQHQKGDCCGGCCVLECYEAEVEVVCWKCECEDFCLPGPCCLGCKNAVDACSGKGGKGGNCGKGGCCQKGGGLLGGCCAKLFCWRDEEPGCPSYHHRKVLYRKIEVVKVPAYRWVINGGKGGCCKGAVLPTLGEGEVPPPPPVDAAQLRYQIQDQAGNVTPVQGMTAQLADVITR